MKVLLAQLNPTVGDLFGNCEKILDAIACAKKSGCELLVTSELAITGYPPEDFLLLSDFISATEKSLDAIVQASSGIGLVIGTLRRNSAKSEKPLFNTAAICSDGKLIGYHDKVLLPTYDVFDEKRYFESGKKSRPWQIGPYRIGVTICEDLWQHSRAVQETSYREDPILELKSHSLDLIVNLSASPFHQGKFGTRLGVSSRAAVTLGVPLVLCNQVGGNDSLIFDGLSFAVNGKGELTGLARGFREHLFIVDVDRKEMIEYSSDPWKELHSALILGLQDYFQKSGFQRACIGISGGIDSALVACLATEALGKDNVLGLYMPSRYSSSESKEDAEELARNLDISFQVVPIEGPFQSYLDLLEPQFGNKPFDVTEENIQARIRGMILMAFSNKFGLIVLSTGNKSELALGYSTLYGDMCGGLAVISDLTKAEVYGLSRWINKQKPSIPDRIFKKPPSAELRPNQKDSDALPDYAIVDAVLKDYIEKSLSPHLIAAKHQFPESLVKDLIKRIHQNEYKRRQSPLGLRVTEKAFSVGRRYPIVQKWV